MKSNASRRAPRTISTGRDRTPVIPDWSVVTSAAARKALEDILIAGRWDWRLDGIDAQSARVLATVLRLYVRYSRPPLLSEVAESARMSETLAKQLLRRLAGHDHVLLAADQTSICGAYPFTEKVTGHAVVFERSGKRLNTMCAVDALGASAMCREDLSIHSTCRFCGNDIVGRVVNDGMKLQEVQPADAVVWVGLRQSCGCAADSLCTELLLFCTEDHLTRWRSDDRGVKGHVLTAREGFEVGKALFIDRAMIGQTQGERSVRAAASGGRTARR